MSTCRDAPIKTKAQQQIALRAVAKRAATRRLVITTVVLGAAAIAVLFAIYSNSSKGGSPGGGDRFQVGTPARGAQAPIVRLASTAGGEFDLSAQRGKTVLLYFQEGVGCQPCWDQIRDLEKNTDALRGLGIDEVVSITGNDLGVLRQKVADEHLSTAVLADPDLAVSKTYHANDYGMMGSSADGHTFVVVGPDGLIRWRADYGGAPNYTMYVPVDDLVADMRAGLAK